MNWAFLHPMMTHAHLGHLPEILSDRYEGTAAEQLDRNYAHGGGYQPMPDWQMEGSGSAIRYPGDLPIPALAVAKLRHETLYFYLYSWLAIVQPDGTFAVTRVD